MMNPAILNGFEDDAYNKHSKLPSPELPNHLNEQLGWTPPSVKSDRKIEVVSPKTTFPIFQLESSSLTNELSIGMRHAWRSSFKTKQKIGQKIQSELNFRLADLKSLTDEEQEPFSEVGAKQLAEFVDNYRLGIPCLSATADGAIRAIWNTQAGKIELDFSDNTICTLLISKEPGNRSFAGRITAFDTAPRLFKEFMRYFIATRSSG